MCGVLLHVYANDQNNTAFNQWIRKVRHRYALTTFYSPNVRRSWNYKERHGNATASKAYVAVTLYDRLVRLERHGNATASKAYVAVTLDDRLVGEGSQRHGFDSLFIRHKYVVRAKVTQRGRSPIVVWSVDTDKHCMANQSCYMY